ncbi:MAG TPA: T9SS type A sorting domain-containing protein [Ignavibacteria bacterium]|nr:T9SS type A sorting domain-containing protein [Ignavibacteria bacterium]
MKLIIIIFLFLLTQSINAQWVPSTGLSTKNITSIVKTSDKIFAGGRINIFTSGEIFVSSDNGISFSLVDMGFDPSGIFSMISFNDTIIAGTYEKGVAISTNNGVNWILNNVNSQFRPGVFEIIKNKSNIIAYVNDGVALYLSSNGGFNWTGISGHNMTVITNFYASGDTVFASHRHGISYSTNNGYNWTRPANNGLTANPDLSTPANSIIKVNDKLICGELRKLFVSTDNGNNWIQAGNLELSQNSVFTDIVKHNNKLFTSVYRLTSPNPYGVYVDENMNFNWGNIASGLPVGSIIHNLMIHNGRLYAGLQAHGVYSMDLNNLTNIKNSVQLQEFNLIECFPNPFNPSINIKLKIKESTEVNLSIYNLGGMKIKELYKGKLQKGNFEYKWNAEENVSGVYFVVMNANGNKTVQKIVLMK